MPFSASEQPCSKTLLLTEASGGEGTLMVHTDHFVLPAGKLFLGALL